MTNLVGLSTQTQSDDEIEYSEDSSDEVDSEDEVIIKLIYDF